MVSLVIDDTVFVQRENVMRLNENNHDILRTLVGVLEESQNPVAIAVAAHDLGEYVRYYPRGKK
jgi:V-type H+-transporting ATPase subunit H